MDAMKSSERQSLRDGLQVVNYTRWFYFSLVRWNFFPRARHEYSSRFVRHTCGRERDIPFSLRMRLMTCFKKLMVDFVWIVTGRLLFTELALLYWVGAVRSLIASFFAWKVLDRHLRVLQPSGAAGWDWPMSEGNGGDPRTQGVI